MKSPLVEALRNATETTGEEPSVPAGRSSTAPDDQPQVGAKRILLDELAADADDLSLIEPSDDLVAQEPTNDPEADGEFTETIVEVDGVEARPAADSARPAATALARIAVRARWFSVARAGRLAPFVCILLGLLSTGAYLLYQDVDGALENAGLAALPDKVGGYGPAEAAQVPEPQGPLQRFPLIESGRDYRPPVAAPAGQAALEAGAAAGSGLVTSPDIEVRKE
jgi:hypothetical protein